MAVNVTLNVSGAVQKVGYRDNVQDIALQMGIKGYVRNLEDRTVEVVCEGEQKEVDKFKKAIAIRTGFVNVREVKVIKTKKASNKFKYFTIKRGEMSEEVGERFDAAISHLGVAVNEIKDTIEKGNVSLTTTIKDGNNELKDTIKEGNAELGNKVDKGFHTLGTKIDNLGNKIDNNFNRMDQKYDVISERMLTIMEELKQARVESAKATENLTKVVQTFVEMQKKQ